MPLLFIISADLFISPAMSRSKRKISETTPTTILDNKEQEPSKYQRFNLHENQSEFNHLDSSLSPSLLSSLSSSSKNSVPFRPLKRLGSPLEFDHKNIRPPKTLRRKKRQTATRDQNPVTSTHDTGFADHIYSHSSSPSVSSIPSVYSSTSSIVSSQSEVPLKNQLLHSLHLERLQRLRANATDTKTQFQVQDSNQLSSTFQHVPSVEHGNIPSHLMGTSETGTRPSSLYHTSEIIFDPGSSWGEEKATITSPFFRNSRTDEQMEEG